MVSLMARIRSWYVIPGRNAVEPAYWREFVVAAGRSCDHSSLPDESKTRTRYVEADESTLPFCHAKVGGAVGTITGVGPTLVPPIVSRSTAGMILKLGGVPTTVPPWMVTCGATVFPVPETPR